MDVNEPMNSKGMETALIRALRNLDEPIVKLLLQNGANIAQTMYSDLVGIFDHFIFARFSESASILNILLTYGADITVFITEVKTKKIP